jgi:hypothetical protein
MLTHLDLAVVYSKLSARSDYYRRRIERTKHGLTVDREIIAKWKKEKDDYRDAIRKLSRQMQSMHRSIRRWTARLGSIEKLLGPIRRVLRGSRVRKPSGDHIIRKWPRWLGYDGKMKYPNMPEHYQTPWQRTEGNE